MDYLFNLLILIGIYSILAVSLDLLAGHAGLLSVAHAAFYGLGAYTSSLLAVQLGTPFPFSLVAGILVASLFSFVVSAPSLRLHDDYFVIVTFGFQMILFSILNNWMSLTGGSLGIGNIPRISLFGFTIRSSGPFFVLVCVVACLAYAVVFLLTDSPFGRVLRAIREDEHLTRSLGKNTFRFKVTAFAISAGLAASAGTLYAHYMTFIDPTSFTVMESILVISMVIIGGAGSRFGPLIGAIILVILPEILRFIGMTSSVAANVRQIIYGCLLIGMMIFMPRGIAGKYGFGR